MKSGTRFAIFTILVMFVFYLTSFAQDDPERYQGYIVWEDAVFPSEVGNYEKATKLQMELFAEQHFPKPVWLFTTSDFTCYWVFAIDKYADVDTLYDEFGKIFKDVPEKSKAIEEAFAGTHQSTKAWTFVWDRDLSFNPEAADSTDEENNFRFWGFCYVKKGEMDEMKEVFKEWVEISSAHNLKQPFNTFSADIGIEAPFLFWVSEGKNAADFFTTNAKEMNMLGEEGIKQYMKQRKLMRKYEEKLGYFRPDLSYIPKE